MPNLDPKPWMTREVWGGKVQISRTTWSDGGMTCRQIVWGGTKFWSVK